jgi:hypothetical protein
LQEGKDHDGDMSSASSVLSSSDGEDSDGEDSDGEVDDAKKLTKQAPSGAIERKRSSPRASAPSASSKMSARKKIKTSHHSPVKNDGRKRPGRAPPSRRSTKTDACDGQPSTKAHPKTNQRKVKHPTTPNALAQSQSDVMAVLQQLVEQQSLLISMMHEKCTNDNKVTTDSAATGVSSALTATKQSHDVVGHLFPMLYCHEIG